MIAVPTPPPSSCLQTGRWDGRPSAYAPLQVDSRSVVLPSIRQVVPELHLATHQERQRRHNSYPTTHEWRVSSFVGSSNYIDWPTSKGRYIPSELEGESLRFYQVPRLNHRLERSVSSRISPISQHPLTANDSWRSQAPAYYGPSVSVFPELAHTEHRPSVHLPPPPGLERGRDGHYVDDYAAGRRIESCPASHSSRVALFNSRSDDLGTRYHAIPTVSVRLAKRSALSSTKYKTNQMSMMGNGGETKQLRPRGNLPKGSTDKLRSWFHAHLQHPYPTEDEKQELMHQTGLQMKQILNWFINARRRQLPAMINNARARTDVMPSRSGVDLASIGSADVDTVGLDRESIYDANSCIYDSTVSSEAKSRQDARASS